MAKKTKVSKGEYGYLKQKKQGALLHTLLMVAIGLAIFGVGLLLNKMEATNIFTVFAFLMVLPAAKALVTVIILSPYKESPKDKIERLASYAKPEDTVLYDVVFTSSERVMHLDCIYVTDRQLICYTGREKDKATQIQDYFKKEIKSRCLDYVVYFATGEKQIQDRMRLRGEENSTDHSAREEVLEMLKVFIV